MSQAAVQLGITARAVRLRIEAGTLPATMLEGRYYIAREALGKVEEDFLPRKKPGRKRTLPSSPSSAENEDPQPVGAALPTLAARAQLAAVMEEWITPLVTRIGELERENGVLTERTAHLEAERDRANEERERLAALLEASGARSVTPGAARDAQRGTPARDTEITAPHVQTVPWWRRWFS